MDTRDYFVIGLVSAAWAAGTVWVFVHPSAESFTAWCGLCATMGGIYHWLTIRDSKIKDAE